jgi:class 3 adenylate cyclase
MDRIWAELSFFGGHKHCGLMKFLNTLASYVPGRQCNRTDNDGETYNVILSDAAGIIIEQLLQDEAQQEVPFRKAFETVVVFCDISGFTKLSEFMARSGKGAEGVARAINKYFQMMVKIVSSGGGDILKFAGDAMIVSLGICSFVIMILTFTVSFFLFFEDQTILLPFCLPVRLLAAAAAAVTPPHPNIHPPT